MSTGSDPIDYKEAYEEKCRVAENTRLALMKALARVNKLTEALNEAHLITCDETDLKSRCFICIALEES